MNSSSSSFPAKKAPLERRLEVIHLLRGLVPAFAEWDPAEVAKALDHALGLNPGSDVSDSDFFAGLSLLLDRLPLKNAPRPQLLHIDCSADALSGSPLGLKTRVEAFLEGMGVREHGIILLTHLWSGLFGEDRGIRYERRRRESLLLRQMVEEFVLALGKNDHCPPVLMLSLDRF